MNNFMFGIVATVVGMGGTLLSLYLLNLTMVLLKRLFPLDKEEKI
ncbi:MAG: OadG-related small transporter subunit [Thermodesulfobacteriota bacterium]|nr:OadG-related small transporter subunit [Thermodesulfobacteriota bacterium]